MSRLVSRMTWWSCLGLAVVFVGTALAQVQLIEQTAVSNVSGMGRAPDGTVAFLEEDAGSNGHSRITYIQTDETRSFEHMDRDYGLCGYDGQDQAHILPMSGYDAYTDREYYRLANGSWQEQTLQFPYPPDDMIFCTHGVPRVDAGGGLHVVMEEYSGLEGDPVAIYYFEEQTGVWSRAVVMDEATLGRDIILRDISFAPDASGNIHILYDYDLLTGDTVTGNQLWYATDSGGTFTYELVRERTDAGFAGNPCSLRVTSAGQPVAAINYRNVAVTGSELTGTLEYVERLGPNNWKVTTVASKSDNYAGGDGDGMTGYNCILALDGQDRPHIVFNDMAATHMPFQAQQTGQIRYAHRGAGGWSVATVVPDTVDAGHEYPDRENLDMEVSADGGRVYVIARRPTGLYWGVFGQRMGFGYDLYVFARPVPPAATTLQAPTGVQASRRPVFSWTDVKDVQWYQLWLNRDGKKHLSKWVNDIQWTPPTDLPPGSYTWWVQTINAIGPGPWSASAAFTIEKQLPAEVTPLAPFGVQVLGQRRFEFSWQPADLAGWYHLVVNRVGEGAYAAKWVPASATTWTFDVDFRAGDYRWWIAGWNPDGYGPWSGGTDFTVPAMKPGVLGQISPTGGACVAAGSVDFQWQADARATWYQLWSGCPAESKTQWYDASLVASGGVARAAITHAVWGAYQWYVRGFGPDGMGDWSSAADFVCGRPNSVSGAPALLTWDNSYTPDAGWYHVWINNVTGGGRTTERAWWFKRDATTDAGGGNRSVPLTPELAAGDYEWSIRAWGPGHGTGPWSETHNYSVP